jgi:copper homeostasis protein
MISNNASQNVLVEVCVDTLASAIAAQSGGASRIELCSALSEGGLTPSSGTISQALKLLSLRIFVMIRPRAGNFVYSANDFDIMLKDIVIARESGANGIVSGILNPDDTVDVDHTRLLVEAASPLPVTFHRAFDLTPDPYKALEEIITCGCKRILTSGQQATAIEGQELISKLIRQAGDRVIIMPGSGLNEQNVDALIRTIGAKEIHLSGRKKITTDHNNIKKGPNEASFIQMHETDPLLIHRVILEANSTF